MTLYPPMLILLLTILYFPSVAQNGNKSLTVMFYNVENLFDTEDDPLITDEEYLPNGERRWNSFRLNAKLNNISKVIANSGHWEPPAVIGLCEIENQYVLERLVNHPVIRNWNYKIIHKNSPDQRGIDVAAIYREDVFQPLSYNYFSPVAENKPVPATREILHVSGILAGLDTVHLYFNHWPSRYGGLMETRGLRQRAAARLFSEVTNLQKLYRHPAIIIMGDFNDQPDDDSMTTFLKASLSPGNDPLQLYNLSYRWQKEGKGTLKHQSMWNIFDQIIISGSLLRHNGRLLYTTPSDAVILEAPFLFQKDERYTGRKLFRTYEGYKYAGGYSDHLPVLLILSQME
jgi:hypothetical protein